MTNATCRAARTGLVLAAFILAGVLGREAGMAHAEGEAPPAGRTTIYVARKIVTMEPALPEARVVAVRDGLVLGLGERIEDLSPWLASGDYDVDRRFEHDVVMPGFIDPHLHPMMAAVLLPTHFITPEDWDLPRGRMHGVRTPAGYREALGRAIAETPDDGRPFITWGHHAHWHGPVDRALLDELAPERAVIVWQRSFHELTFNTKALERLGLGSEASFAEAIEAPGIEPAHADFAAGHVSETAMKAILPRMAPFVLTPEHLARGLSSLRQMMLAAGVTTIADMATGIFAPFEQEARTLRHTFGGPDASARILLVPTAAGLVAEYGSVDAAVERLHALAPELTSANVLIDDRVKLLADGAFFALAMRMNPPGYTDGHEGKWITAPAELRRLARAYWSKGFTIHCHVNGDEGLDVVLDLLESLQRETPRVAHRFTLEHLGYSTEAQSRRIAELGAFVSAQPNYLYLLGHAYGESGLGRDRAAQISRLGSLERKGVTVALHSDTTMAPVAPLFLAWQAATRETLEGGVLTPSERLSLDAALRAITIDAATVIGREAEIGSIAAGKRADFAVLDRDPYDVGAKGLAKIRVRGVVFGGRPVAATP